MSSTTHLPTDEDYLYSEEQFNPSVKIHAVTRKRSFFGSMDYVLFACSIFVALLIYVVRIYPPIDLLPHTLTNTRTASNNCLVEYFLEFTTLTRISSALFHQKGIYDDH